MNIIKTTDLGGFPFEMDDLRFMINGIQEAFKGVLSGIGGYDNGATGKLSGCKDNGSGVVSPGFLAINGEVLYYPGGSWPPITPGPGKSLHFKLESIFDSGGLETFENGSSHDTWEIRRAVLVYEVASGPVVIHDDQRAVYLGESTPLYQSSLSNSWADQNGENVSYLKSSTSLLSLIGAAFGPLANKNNTIFTLPVDFRPALTKQIPINVLESPSLAFKPQMLLIGSNGDIKLDPAYTSALTDTTVKVYFDGITVRI